MKISESIIQHRQEVQQLADTNFANLDDIENRLQELTKISNQISDYWLGSWVKNQDYYKNFFLQNENYIQVSYDQLYEFLCKKARVDFKGLHDSVKSIFEKISRIK